MEIENKHNIPIDSLPGRGLARVVGKNSYFASEEMTVGYAFYDKRYGEMEPHHHAEETVIITKSVGGCVAWGPKKDNLSNVKKLEEGMILHIPAGEWHVFRYEPGGCIEIIFIYAGTNNIRPEDK